MEVKIFNSPQFGNVRTVGSSDELLFCLSDVCRALDLTTSKVAQRLSEDVLSKHPLQTEGGMQQVNFINEDGLYDVILDSRKPEARRFRKWVTSEVLPAIRKDGGYIEARRDETPEEIMARALIVANATIERIKKQNEAQIKQIEAQKEQLIEQAPKVGFYDDVTGSTDTIDMASVAKVLNMGIGRNKLFEILRQEGVLTRKNAPFEVYVKRGWFRQIETSYINPKGDVCIYVKTVVFQKGVDGIRRLIKKIKG